MFKRINIFLQTINFYNQPVNIQYQGKNITSACGGLVTIFIFLLSITLFYQPSKQFFSANKFNWKYHRAFDNQNTIELKNNEVYFAININGNNKSDAQLQIRYNRSQQMNQIIVSQKAIICNQTQIQKLFGTKVLRQFQLNKPKLYYCPPPNFLFYLKGIHLKSSNHATITIQNKTSLNNATQFNVQILYFGYFFNFQIQQATYINIQKIASFNINTRRQQILNYQLWIGKKVLDDRDTNIWPSSLSFLIDSSKYYIYPKIDKRDVSFQKGDVNQIMRLSLWMGSSSEYCTRGIVKMDEYLSFLGGIFEFIYLLGIAVMGSYSKIKMRLTIGKSIVFTQNKHPNNLHKQFNYFLYLKYLIKQLLKCFQFSQDQQKYNKIQNYAYRVTSINQIQKRILILQKAIANMVPQQQLIQLKNNLCIQLQNISQSQSQICCEQKRNSSKRKPTLIHEKFECKLSRKRNKSQQTSKRIKSLQIRQFNSQQQLQQQYI